MQYRPLGHTGLVVSELCFGTMTFGGTGTFWANIGGQSQAEANNLVARCLDAGVNFFDTAEAYSDGESERLLGQALAKRRAEVVIATKVSGRPVYDLAPPGAMSRKHILRAIDASLTRLDTDYVDLYQAHRWDPDTPLEETLEALADVVRAGKARYIGCSNYAAWQVMKARGLQKRHGWARFASVQSYYSLAGRDLEREMVPVLQDQKMGLLVWSPLAGGYLTGKFASGAQPEGARRSNRDFPPVDKDRAARCVALLQELAPAHNASVARLALAWLLHQPGVTSVILGARTMEQLEDNLQAAEVAFSPEELQRLGEASALPLEYPGWMLAWQAQMPRTPSAAAPAPPAGEKA
jgi:aryl-alcohol dehydrogenase-like predicted oxidoreductase